MVIAIGNDHAGTSLKQELLPIIESLGITAMDLGTNTSNIPVDYPDYAKAVSEAILDGRASLGLLICGTGIGMSISANRHAGIRAALCHDVFSAQATRLHNDANVLVLGARVVGGGHAQEITKTFLSTQFSNQQRHIKRLDKL